MTIDFKKGSSYSAYTPGTIYFEKSTHLIKVGISDSSCEVFSGVRSAGWNSTTKVLTIVNEAGENIELNFADVASAEGVNSVLETLRDDINSKITAPTTGPSAAGQVLRTVSDGNNGFTTEWAILPAAVDYSVSVSDASTTTGYLKSYTFSQGGNVIATVDIPKDLVVTSGSVIAGTWSNNEFTESEQGEGQAIKLVIANQNEPVYINVAKLVDLYTAAQNATKIQLAVSNNNEISATIVAGSIEKTDLDASVQASLGKADTALQLADVSTGSTNGTISFKGTDIAVKGLGSAAYLNANSLVQSVTDGSVNGTINVDGTAVAVHGLGTAAYTDSNIYATAEQGVLAASAVQGVSGENAVTDSSYVAVSVEASTDASNNVTLSSHANVTTHDVSTAVANTADGLALASEVKSYVDFKSTKEWAQFE